MQGRFTHRPRVPKTWQMHDASGLVHIAKITFETVFILRPCSWAVEGASPSCDRMPYNWLHVRGVVGISGLSQGFLSVARRPFITGVPPPVLAIILCVPEAVANPELARSLKGAMRWLDAPRSVEEFARLPLGEFPTSSVLPNIPRNLRP
jgi:hypothetical protein